MTALTLIWQLLLFEWNPVGDDDDGIRSFSSFRIEFIDEQVDEVDMETDSVSLVVASIILKLDELRNDEFEFGIELPHGTITLTSSKHTVTFIIGA